MPILRSDTFFDLVKDDPLVYVDAGARGGLQGPWAQIDDGRLRVVAFEPDAAASDRLERPNDRQWTVIPKALWCNEGRITLHLAEIPATSSVHPPDFLLLSQFAAQHGEPRRTKATIDVSCTTLDATLAQIGCTADFLKIDTQGAEYEILQGAERALRESIFGAIVETWTVEVHKGQKLTGDILTFMQKCGFSLFDLNVAAAWQRHPVDRLPLHGKGQITGLDLLFFKEPTAFARQHKGPATLAKAAAIAELYGFPDVAIELLNAAVPSDHRVVTLQTEIQTSARTPTARSGANAVLRRLLHLFHRRRTAQGSDHAAAKLHY